MMFSCFASRMERCGRGPSSPMRKLAWQDWLYIVAMIAAVALIAWLMT